MAGRGRGRARGRGRGDAGGSGDGTRTVLRQPRTRATALLQTRDLPARVEQMRLGPSSGVTGHDQPQPSGSGSVQGGSSPATHPLKLSSKKGDITRTKAKPEKFLVNYFNISTVPDWVLHQYRVDIAPEEERASTRKFLLRIHKNKLGGYLFDGTVLYTAERLTTEQHRVVTLTSEDPKAGKIFTITLRHVGQVQRGDYSYIQVYNLLVRACVSAIGFKLIGRNYYNPEEAIRIPQYKKSLLPGIKSSIRQHETSILWCCDISYKVVREETVYEIIRDCQQRDPQNYKRAVEDEIVGCIVLTKYNNKTYRVDCISWDETPQETFRYRDEEMSFDQYMKEKYQEVIRDLRQPLLISIAKARDVRAGRGEMIKLIPELCYCTGLTDVIRQDWRIMKVLAGHTILTPATRIKRLMEINQKLLANQQVVAKLAEFKMSLGSNLISVEGRVEEQEKIICGSSDNPKDLPVKKQNDWISALTKYGFLNPPQPLANWFIFCPEKAKSNVRKFVDSMKFTGIRFRFIIEEPTIVQLKDNIHVGDYLKELNHVLERYNPRLIMCVIEQHIELYKAIKRKCCVDRPVPSQVILTRTVKTSVAAAKVVIQMCCKLGGGPWTVQIPLKGLMVVGYDVCHIKSKKSFGAMVASLNHSMTRYYSAVIPQGENQELSHNLALHIAQAVIKYKEVNHGTLPRNILIYRDGVGEGQLSYVETTEVNSVKNALKKVYNGQEHFMTFVIVTKRINTRIFTKCEKNPLQGSIIDDVITDPEKYDFFLVSQTVNQGTVNPTAYNVIHDEIGMPPERLQRLTYKLCHLYFNWNGTVRVPAPCQYAHKLAFLAGKTIQMPSHSSMQDLLYFL